jgi:Fur family transcriptional regulator, ferric uptake regulator
MAAIAARFERFLRTRGLRLTRQRAEILRAIYATHQHVTAEAFYEALRRSGRGSALKISRATVYRTLSLLAEGGFVNALDVGRETGTLYEHSLGHRHHDHMICLSCGKISEFSDERLEQVQDAAVRRAGFVATSHRLSVFGTCAKCARKLAGRAEAQEAGPPD